MYPLTKAEEEVMQVLWELESGFVKELIEHFPEPKPAYNTVSTVVRILEQKGAVGHKAFGRTHKYFPKTSKEEYSKLKANHLVNNFFSGSYQELLSFFVKDKKLSLSELESILNQNKEK